MARITQKQRQAQIQRQKAADRVQELIQQTSAARKAVIKDSPEFILDHQKKIVGWAKRNAPVVTGELRRGIKRQKVNGVPTLVSNAPHAFRVNEEPGFSKKGYRLLQRAIAWGKNKFTRALARDFDKVLKRVYKLK